MAISPAKGISYAIEGLSLIKRPELRAFVIAPIITSILIYLIMGYFCLEYFDTITAAIMGYLPDWEWLIWLIQTVLTISIVLIFAFSFTLVTNIIAYRF